MLDSIYKTWRWPRVVGKVEHNPKNPLEYAKIWRIAQQAAAASGRPVKFGTCSAQVLAFFLDSHTPQYDPDDFPNVVADRIRRCLDCIPAYKLVLSTDCGFGRHGFNRHLAFYKTTAIPLARDLVLKELGLPERYIPAADETLAWDQLPDYEPHTHYQRS